MRSTTSLNEGWIFLKGSPEVEDATSAAEAARTGAGELVRLPHTWNAEDGADGGNDYYRGTCWYVRELAVPELAEGEEAWLEFEGAALTATVYVDGTELARHEDG